MPGGQRSPPKIAPRPKMGRWAPVGHPCSMGIRRNYFTVSRITVYGIREFIEIVVVRASSASGKKVEMIWEYHSPWDLHELFPLIADGLRYRRNLASASEAALHEFLLFSLRKSDAPLSAATSCFWSPLRVFIVLSFHRPD